MANLSPSNSPRAVLQRMSAQEIEAQKNEWKLYRLFRLSAEPEPEPRSELKPQTIEERIRELEALPLRKRRCCQYCRELIPIKRLVALPNTHFCISCAQAREEGLTKRSSHGST